MPPRAGFQSPASPRWRRDLPHSEPQPPAPGRGSRANPVAGPGGVIWLEKLRPRRRGMRPAEGHTQAGPQLSLRNPLQEGVPSPSFHSWGDRGAGQGAPLRLPATRAALGSCLSCPICRPHTLSGLCHGASLRGPGPGQRPWPRLHGSLRHRDRWGGHHVWP